MPVPVMTASGTAGRGAELAPYFDLSTLGAVVVKSLHAGPWDGNPALRVTETAAGMLNSVGLQGPGVAAWLADDLPPLLATGASLSRAIGPGHQSIIRTAAGYWLLYHGWDGAVGYDNGGRRAMWLQPLDWRKGKPVLGDPSRAVGQPP